MVCDIPQHRYLSQVMRLNFTRESHLRRFSRLLSLNLQQEMDMLKYVTALPACAHAHAHTTHNTSAESHEMRPESFQTQRYATECTQAGVAALLLRGCLGKLVKWNEEKFFHLWSKQS